MWFYVDKLWIEFEEENRKLDESIAKIQADTLVYCNKILANPQRFSTHTLHDAQITKEQLAK